MKTSCNVAMPAALALALALALGFASSACARPQQKIVDACLRGESTPGVSYRQIPFEEIVSAELDDATETARFIRHGGTSAGMWQSGTGRQFGLLYNGRRIGPRRITPLHRQHRPEPFDVALASYGTAHAAQAAHRSYLCITFNFDGLGQSGSFQNVRGLYLIDTRARPLAAYYTGGDIRAPRGQAGARQAGAGRQPARPR